MRKSQKKEILGLLETLRKAHSILQKVRKKQESEKLIEILTLCQESAIGIGNSIEETEGSNSGIIKHLEEYCEMLYQASLPENKTNTYIFKRLNDMLSSITVELGQVKERLEVVFLPYKYSMWDSMESVWKAAQADGDCDAYVMPIPYFDKNSDGSFGAMHYEGELFPQKIPVVSYLDYDIAQRRPDMVFIQNPYDGNNYVTSVHPDYYASKLKDETEKLVYIPYDVCLNDVVNKNFVVTCGTLYADKVILQSEKVREQYIRYFQELAKASGNGPLAQGVEKRFAAVGSPKVDKVRDTTWENIQIPKEWREQIETGTGRKKIILYNTHLNNLMQPNGKKFIDKLEEVFELIKRRKDVVLLWRPHPLSIATAQSMNPSILPQYLEAVEWFQREKIGIYDDSPDMERAIAISDAYYGDGGSLLELYKITGKPILRQSFPLE